MVNRSGRAALTILAAVALAACGSSPAVPSASAPEQPTPKIVYVTPAPTVAATQAPDPTVEPAVVEEPTESPSESPAAEGVAFKSWATVGDWDVRITKVDWNAAKALQKANMFNDKVPKGKVAVMVYVEGKYHGDSRSNLDPSFAFRAMGKGMVEYTTFDDPTCGVLPKPELVLNDPTVRKGGTVKGWGACWVVDKGDVSTLIAFWAPLLSDEITGFYLR